MAKPEGSAEPAAAFTVKPLPLRHAGSGANEPRSEKVVIRNLDFFYGPDQALYDVSLTLYDKSVTAIIGPSGCGKSTLLRVINRIFDLYPDQRATGEVLIGGTNILDPEIDVNALRSRVGMVFQKPTPFPMSIYENITFALQQARSPSDVSMPERVEAALRRAALWEEVKELLPTDAEDLSGGQQQRLCIARAIGVEPDVLLLDEPCSALDPLSTNKIENLIDDLRCDSCIAIVTHNIEQAARVSDFAAFMYLGKLVEFGRTEDVFTHPTDPRTQAFITGRFG